MCLNTFLGIFAFFFILTAAAATSWGTPEDTALALSTPKTSSKKNRTAHRRVGEHKSRSSLKNAYQCLYCPYTSRFRGNLIQHARTHTGEKPYKCIVCSYAFTQRQALKVHMRRHTGEKPFTCSMCPSTFQWKHQLKKHVEEQH